MAQQREATTNRLVGIIANIKMERKSGQLRVKRGEGLTSEEGILTFTQGQVTQASVGRRSGADALNWLCTWRKARYIFILPDPEEGEMPTQPFVPSSSPGKTTTSSELHAEQVHTDRLETEPLPTTSREVPRTFLVLNEATTRIERSGLSRSHRRLYLLVDGRRSVDELEPLMGRKAEEIRGMLHDLEWLGVIQIVHRGSEAR